MRKRLKKYLVFIKEINITDMTEKEKKTFRTEMLVQIGFFQHERLVHLIVMVTIAVFTFFSALGCLVWPGILIIVLTGLLMVLLIPYIIHYYILENGVQKLYEYYDKIMK
ncbi:MAG: hypothetical protein KAQ68_00570 [Clostridiales bacterium]|nr:hypothetical protein [Clostridiales bacterium]